MFSQTTTIIKDQIKLWHWYDSTACVVRVLPIKSDCLHLLGWCKGMDGGNKVWTLTAEFSLYQKRWHCQLMFPDGNIFIPCTIQGKENKLYILTFLWMERKQLSLEQLWPQINHHLVQRKPTVVMPRNKSLVAHVPIWPISCLTLGLSFIPPFTTPMSWSHCFFNW